MNNKFFVFVVALIVFCWLFISVVLYKTTKAISEHGLKSVIERIWDGPRKDNK